MSDSPLFAQADPLPDSLPLFPLPNAVAMPGCQLPLNVFEPRYINMVMDALGEHRLIGMVQPEGGQTNAGEPRVYTTGTAGRITHFHETDDKRLLIVLTGVCRFDIIDEMTIAKGYRRASIDWRRFQNDLNNPPNTELDRGYLIRELEIYLMQKKLETDWKTLEEVATPDLINRLICHLPFEVAERQLLIQSVNLEERMLNLLTLLRCEATDSRVASHRAH